MPKTPSTSTKKKRPPWISPAVRAIAKHVLKQAIDDRRLLAIRKRPNASRREIGFQFQRVFDWLDAYFKLRGVEGPRDSEIARRYGPWPPALMPSKGMRGLVAELTYAVSTAAIHLRCSPISETLRAWDMDLDDLDVEILAALEMDLDRAISTHPVRQRATATNVSKFHRGNGAPPSGSRS